MTEEDIRDFMEQLSAPMILLGDFNAFSNVGKYKTEHKRKNAV